MQDNGDKCKLQRVSWLAIAAELNINLEEPHSGRTKSVCSLGCVSTFKRAEQSLTILKA